MDQPVPPSSQGSDEAPNDGHATVGQSRPGRSRPSTASNEAHEVHGEDNDDDGFDSEEFREWMRNRSRAGGRRNRDRRRDSSDGSRDRDGDGSRTNAGPAPEWDGDGLSVPRLRHKGEVMAGYNTVKTPHKRASLTPTTS